MREVLELYHQHNGYFEHAQKVRQFAVQIFDATADLHGLGPRARRLLEFSALLHDIGRSMGKGHERHSYDLILDYKFKNLAKWEKRIIALVALYHNGSAENVDYSRQWRLRSEEQFAVRRMAGILRLADALDSSDKQAVTRLRISRELGAASIVRYRYSLKSPKEASSLVIALGVGMACGVGLYPLAIIVTLFMVIIFNLFENLPVGVKRALFPSDKTWILKLRVSDSEAGIAMIKEKLGSIGVDYKIRRGHLGLAFDPNEYLRLKLQTSYIDDDGESPRGEFSAQVYARY